MRKQRTGRYMAGLGWPPDAPRNSPETEYRAALICASMTDSPESLREVLQTLGIWKNLRKGGVVDVR